MKQKAKKKANDNCCCGCGTCNCTVEALVRIDSKGQMVLPKSVREKVGVKTGDKLAVISMGCGDTCCVILTKTDKLNKIAEDMLGPVVKKS